MSDTRVHEDLVSVQLLRSRGGGRERELDKQTDTSNPKAKMGQV